MKLIIGTTLIALVVAVHLHGQNLTSWSCTSYINGSTYYGNCYPTASGVGGSGVNYSIELDVAGACDNGYQPFAGTYDVAYDCESAARTQGSGAGFAAYGSHVAAYVDSLLSSETAYGNYSLDNTEDCLGNRNTSGSTLGAC